MLIRIESYAKECACWINSTVFMEENKQNIKTNKFYKAQISKN